MKTRTDLALMLLIVLTLVGASITMAQPAQSASGNTSSRPQGPCDIYASAGDACVAAHSTTRALYAGYNGPLYQVLRQSDGKTLDIGVVEAAASDPGGYADAAAQDKFCADTYCFISIIYDQSPKHNDLTQAPRGGFSGPTLGGFNNIPIADMAPITIMGHKVYGAFIEPGMGLRHDDAKGTAVDDQAEGEYWVLNGKHFNDGCCFDYGNAEIDSRDDDNGTMETLYFGNASPWYSGSGEGPWIMTDQENNLVGCVKQDGSKGCSDLPSIPYRFVTAIAKGEAHRWSSMGGNAQQGDLKVMFDGPRVNKTYDPMRKQGAILLGNGGDNSDGSAGTFYEGALTASGTYPTNATDQLVQANIVAAHYDVAPLSVTPAGKAATPPGLQTFAPGSSQDTTVNFTNTTGAPVTGLHLNLILPGNNWTAVVDGSNSFDQAIAPGASMSATFKVTSGPTARNGDLVGNASWNDSKTGAKHTEVAVEKIRNASPIKINEYRVRSGSPANQTNSFIELYNAGKQSVDISNWTLTEHPGHQAILSTIQIPAGTNLAAGAFYLLGLSNSGLAASAHSGDTVIHVRSIDGMSAGDTVIIGNGPTSETRKIATIGSAAATPTNVWQPLPEGPILTIAPGATNIPVENAAGFAVGQKIALGHGATYPYVASTVEKYEVATVTAIGKPGTQAYLAADAPAGASNIKVTSLADISEGDKIRLDIDSVGHGIETITVTHVGSVVRQTNLTAPVAPGATRINVRRAEGISIGDKITVGAPDTREVVTVSSIAIKGPRDNEINITPALTKAHVTDEWVVSPGIGLDLASPLRFNHAANLPFSDRGTGITFDPATTFAHSSNEPVVALGAGITLDKPLASNHDVDDVVRDEAVKTAGYQGTPAPNQWFGGPAFITSFPKFGRTVTIEEGSMVLRDASGVVADSLNYGSLVDPWASPGYQATSGANQSGCYAPAPNSILDAWSIVPKAIAINTSAGRYPDGAASDSNCNDFTTQAAAVLSTASSAGATNIKVDNVDGFKVGQKIRVDSGSNLEDATIASVGTSGATTLRAAIDAGAKMLPATSTAGFKKGETITIDDGSNSETAVVISTRGFGTITVSAPLTRAHAKDAQISGSGIGLTAALTRSHAGGAEVSNGAPTPGAPNQFHRSNR